MFQGMSPTSLLLILVIVVLVFGTKKLKGMGSDFGGAIKGFRKAMTDDEESDPAKLTNESSATQNVSEDAKASSHQ